MAEVLRISDDPTGAGGSNTVDLLDAAGFELTEWTPLVPNAPSNLYEVLNEKMGLKLTGSTPNNLASQLQPLQKLLRKARQFHNTTWQTTPVYLESQGEDESNPRYALLYGGQVSNLNSIHDSTVKLHNEFPRVTLMLNRAAGWTGAVPGVAGSALGLTATDGPASPTHLFVANYTDDHSLTHIYNFDDSEGTFGSNEIGNSTFNYFDVASATPATDDIVYFGSTEGAYHSVIMNHGGGPANYTLSAIEYWNGAAWSAFAATVNIQSWFVDEVSIFNSSASPGYRALGWQDINNWVANTINGVNAHWIRAKISSVDSHTDYITQTGQVVYVQKKSYIDIPNTAVDGDLPPHLMLSLAGGETGFAPTTPSPAHVARIIYGFRSVGLGTFTDEILFNVTDMNTITGLSNWARTLAAGNTEVADPDSPSGARINMAFTTSGTSLISRAKMTSTDNTVVNGFRGTYRVFLRCQQIGGSAGDCSVQLAMLTGERIDLGIIETIVKTDETALAATDSGIELIDLGTINIPGIPINSNDSVTNDLAFDVYAKRASGSAVLRVYSIKLIPINEASATLNAPINDTSQAFSILHSAGHLEMDSGVIATRLARGTGVQDFTAATIQLESLESFWELHGDFPVIEPSKRYQVYFLLMQYPSGGTFGTGPFMSPTGILLAIELRAHDRYATLRGAD